MPLKTKPLNNNVLIEVQREYDGVSRADENESMSYGIVRDWSINRYHITASAAIAFENDDFDMMLGNLADLNGKVVRWEEFAEGGQTFVEDGKTYALIPWWRLIGYEQ